MTQRTIKVYDKHGFHYDVVVKHHNENGFSIAYYKERIIASRDAQKLRQPYSDDDSEWERFEESLCEWMDEAETDLSIECTQYFNNNQ